MNLPVIYRASYHDGSGARGSIRAILCPASEPGYWSVWAADRADAPISHATVPSTVKALAARLTSEQAADRFPEHREKILARRDSSG